MMLRRRRRQADLGCSGLLLLKLIPNRLILPPQIAHLLPQLSSCRFRFQHKQQQLLLQLRPLQTQENVAMVVSLSVRSCS